MSVNNFDELTQDNQASVQNLVNDYTISEESFSKDELKPQESAKIIGTFTATSVGKKKLLASFTYNEAQNPIILEVITDVIQVKLIGEIIKGLPKKVVVNSKHSIELLIKNNTNFDATDIDIDEGNLLIEAIKEEDINGNVINTYTLENYKNNLKPNGQYRIIGTIQIPEKIGENQLNVLIKYNESKSLTKVEDRLGLSFNELAGGSTIVIDQITADVKIEGTVEPNLLQLKLNQKHEVQFIFKNKNLKFPATNIVISITEETMSAVNPSN